MLKITNIEIVYNDVILAVRGISLEVPQGGIVALLGSNGAGKSTTLKAISGVLDSEEGEIVDGKIEFKGVLLNRKNSKEIVRLGIIQVPEGRRIFDELTVDENLWVGAYHRLDSKKVKEDYQRVMDYFPILRERHGQLAGYLSGGEQQMLVIGRGIMGKPELLMLDEPSLGLAPLIVEEIFQIIQKVNHEERTSILLVEQNANIALQIASYGYIMENGKVVLDGPSQKLAANEDVKEFYLGLTDVGSRKSYRDVKHYKRRKRWLS
ncbi:MAG: ABC transporter ATP-binding protein [Syntrophaceae bacterium]|nr:ABC transporter ATP-binding protein [Syntrophaceae bacterium]